MQSILDRIAARRGTAVRLRVPVRALAQDDAGVTATADGIRLRARRTIVAIAPALSGHLRYAPKLPADRALFVQRAPAGYAVKIALVYDDAFWRADELSGEVVGITGGGDRSVTLEWGGHHERVDRVGGGELDPREQMAGALGYRSWEVSAVLGVLTQGKVESRRAVDEDREREGHAMAIEWKLKGDYIKNCNCAPGCPCDFWADPTHHKCEGMFAMRVREGNYGALGLGGLVIAGAYHWPGPLHEGNGTFQPYVDERATAEQRDALLTIMSGQAGNAWFEVLASVVSKVLEPKFVPIEFDFDLESRHARVRIPGELETMSEPIRNQATGETHRARVDLPNGMEYFRPEIATTKVLRGTGQIRFDCPGAHSSLAQVEHTHRGLVA